MLYMSVVSFIYQSTAKTALATTTVNTSHSATSIITYMISTLSAIMKAEAVLHHFPANSIEKVYI